MESDIDFLINSNQSYDQIDNMESFQQIQNQQIESKIHFQFEFTFTRLNKEIQILLSHQRYQDQKICQL